MVHVDAMSRNPVDPAEEMGPDPIDQQHQRLQDTINLIEEGDDQGCISCGLCSYPELAEDHVLPSA